MPHSRRSFLRTTLGAAALSRALLAQQTTSSTPPPRSWSGDSPVRYPDPDVVALNDRFRKYMVGNTVIQRLFTGTLWAEGVAWNGVGRYLVWSDIPNNRQMRWIEEDGRVTVFRSPSGFSNGNTFDFEGRQLSCEHGNRRVARYEPNGTVTVIADKFQGKRLNSPNDIAVHPDGGIWFTDPIYGIRGYYEGFKGESETKEAVYRVDPKTGQIDKVTDELNEPNGICFSPDYKKVYICDTGTGREVRVYDLDGKTLRNSKRFVQFAVGAADGIRCDIDGNVWAGAPPGVRVTAPSGEEIGMIRLPENCANICFGGTRRNRLFMAASQSLYAVYVDTVGAHIRSFVVLAIAGIAALTLGAQPRAESNNITLVGHNDLAGNGDGGEGLAMQQWPDGRRILYLAHEGQKTCLSIVDVTHPENPVLINQLPSPAPGITRCNSLGLSGNVLVIANQTLKKGQKTAGLWTLDVSDFERIRTAKRLEDLELSFFDTSGPNSRGIHCVWFVDGEFAHLTTGAADFDPTNPSDDQFYMIVDLRDPRHPREVGRWWYPGTRTGDTCLPECLPKRHPQFDDGYRPHQTEVWPDHPDRAYVAYIDGGAFILDISGLAHVKAGREKTFTPKVVGHTQFSPPYPAWTHTFQPIFSRGLALASDEDTHDNCADAPKLVWLLDIRAETNPMVIGTAPLHSNDGELCGRGGRFGAHNLHPNFPSPTSANLKNTTVASWFNGGVRIFHIVDGPAGVPNAPPHLEEIGYYIPAAPPKNPSGTSQMNHAIVDEKGLIYANDRFTGGLYILRYTGAVPLD